MKKYALIITSFLFFYPSYFFAGKTVLNESPAGRCLNALGNFMRKSDVLSDDLKQACAQKDPQKYAELGQLFLSTIFFAHQRPDQKNVDHAEKQLFNGNPTLTDLLIAQLEMTCYGEAQIKDAKLAVSSFESTRAPFPILDLQPHEASLNQAYRIIETLGKKMEWPQEKITNEKNLFAKKVVFFLQNADCDYPQNLSTKFLHNRIKTLEEENKKISEDLLEQKRLSQNQLEIIKKNNDKNEDLEKRYINSLTKLQEATRPLVSTPAILGSTGILTVGLLVYLLQK
jgi:hypothetical protein